MNMYISSLEKKRWLERESSQNITCIYTIYENMLCIKILRFWNCLVNVLPKESLEEHVFFSGFQLLEFSNKGGMTKSTCTINIFLHLCWGILVQNWLGFCLQHKPPRLQKYLVDPGASFSRTTSTDWCPEELLRTKSETSGSHGCGSKSAIRSLNYYYNLVGTGMHPLKSQKIRSSQLCGCFFRGLSIIN